MATNPTFLRYIPKHDDPKLDQSLQLAFKGLKDLNDAIVAIHTRTTTVETTVTNITNSTTTTNTGTTLPAGVNQQTADYPLENSDFGGIVVFQGAGPYAVTLNSGITTPFFCTVFNLAVADLTLASDIGSSINNDASLLIPSGYWAMVWFDGLDWWAIAPVSASAVNQVYNEVPTTVDPTHFSLAHSPRPGTTRFFWDGVRLYETTHFTVSANVITTLYVPPSGGAGPVADYDY